MTDRLLLVIVAAALILWRSGCMTIENGALVDRCGLWQLLSGQPLIISLGDLPERIVEHQVEIPVYPHEQETKAAPPTTYLSTTGTSTVIRLAPMMGTYFGVTEVPETCSTQTVYSSSSSATTYTITSGTGGAIVCTAGTNQ
jgi:hypothetical protein